VNWFLPLAWILLPVALLLSLAGALLILLAREPDTPFVSVVGWIFLSLGIPLALGSAWMWWAFR
jgi:hypothetical protein